MKLRHGNNPDPGARNLANFMGRVKVKKFELLYRFLNMPKTALVKRKDLALRLRELPEDKLIKGPFRDMVYALAIPPIFDLSISSQGIDDNFFSRFAESQNE
jgi:hypothetical protein